MTIECAPFGVYNFKNVAFNIDGNRVIGFSEGDDVITITRTTDIGTPIVGADGTSIVSISADQSATVVIKLLPTSPFNQYLQQKASRMRVGAVTGLTFALGMTDMSTGEAGGCTTAIVTKEPEITKGANVQGDREWTFFCPCWQPDQITIGA